MTQIYSTLDTCLYNTIRELIKSDPAYLNVRLGVSQGFVHLAGTVASMDLRSAAEELAAGVPGVRGVVNRIEAPGAPSPSRTINLKLPTQEE